MERVDYCDSCFLCRDLHDPFMENTILESKNVFIYKYLKLREDESE